MNTLPPTPDLNEWFPRDENGLPYTDDEETPKERSPNYERKSKDPGGIRISVSNLGALINAGLERADRDVDAMIAELTRDIAPEKVVFTLAGSCLNLLDDMIVISLRKLVQLHGMNILEPDLVMSDGLPAVQITPEELAGSFPTSGSFRLVLMSEVLDTASKSNSTLFSQLIEAWILFREAHSFKDGVSISAEYVRYLWLSDQITQEGYALISNWQAVLRRNIPLVLHPNVDYLAQLHILASVTTGTPDTPRVQISAMPDGVIQRGDGFGRRIVIDLKRSVWHETSGEKARGTYAESLFTQCAVSALATSQYRFGRNGNGHNVRRTPKGMPAILGRQPVQDIPLKFAEVHLRGVELNERGNGFLLHQLTGFKNEGSIPLHHLISILIMIQDDHSLVRDLIRIHRESRTWEHPTLDPPDGWGTEASAWPARMGVQPGHLSR